MTSRRTPSGDTVNRAVWSSSTTYTQCRAPDSFRREIAAAAVSRKYSMRPPPDPENPARAESTFAAIARARDISGPACFVPIARGMLRHTNSAPYASLGSRSVNSCMSLRSSTHSFIQRYPCTLMSISSTNDLRQTRPSSTHETASTVSPSLMAILARLTCRVTHSYRSGVWSSDETASKRSIASLALSMFPLSISALASRVRNLISPLVRDFLLTLRIPRSMISIASSARPLSSSPRAQ